MLMKISREYLTKKCGKDPRKNLLETYELTTSKVTLQMEYLLEFQEESFRVFAGILKCSMEVAKKFEEVSSETMEEYLFRIDSTERVTQNFFF